jgi:hypothetical protein
MNIRAREAKPGLLWREWPNDDADDLKLQERDETSR